MKTKTVIVLLVLVFFALNVYAESQLEPLLGTTWRFENPFIKEVTFDTDVTYIEGEPKIHCEDQDGRSAYAYWGTHPYGGSQGYIITFNHQEIDREIDYIFNINSDGVTGYGQFLSCDPYGFCGSGDLGNVELVLDCTYSISPSNGSFSSGGGNSTISVTTSDSSCSWSASVCSDWVSLSPTSGTGSGSVTIMVAENPGVARNCSATIAGYPYTITQAGALEQTAFILTKNSPNHTVTSGSDEKVYGTSVSNHITLEIGASAELINFPGQNSIQIQSSSDLFTVSRSGTVVTFQGSDGTVLKIPATKDAQTISFNGEESRVLQIHNNQVVLDDQVITTTPASIESNQDEPVTCGAYVAPGVWKEFDCYNLAAIGKTTSDDPFTPSWRLIGGYWQWGRKGPDPSLWYDTNTEHFAHGPTGPGSSEANPGTINDWDDEHAPDDGWSDTVKTANDPCPAGYRVPTKSQWEGVDDNNAQSTVGTWGVDDTNYSSGRFFGSDLMLPAAGSRYDGGNGVLDSRGGYGGCWSSSEDSSSSAWGLYFNSWTADASTNSRRYGHSMRCVSE